MIPMNEVQKETYPFGNMLKDIYGLKQEISYYTGWKNEDLKAVWDRKCELFWVEVAFLFQSKLLRLKNSADVIKIRIELNKGEGTVLYRFENDEKGVKRAFTSETYEPQMFWNVTQSPIEGVGLIRKQVSEDVVYLELWFPM